MIKLIIFSLLVLTAPTWAYVPQLSLILTRTAENHGNGIYLVDQDVSLVSASGTHVVIHEQWLTEGARKFRLRAQSKKGFDSPLDLTIVYDEHKKYYLDTSGRLRSNRLTADWIEPFFYFRSSKYLANLLESMNVLPKPLQSGKTTAIATNDVKYTHENFVRLSRAGGVVSYAIGTPSTPNSATPLPGLWIEQDNFVIKKVRVPSSATVTAEKYQRHHDNLWLPQNRDFSWNGNRASIIVTRVRHYSSRSSIRQRFGPQSLNLQKEPHLAMTLPSVDLVKDFYSRFR